MKSLIALFLFLLPVTALAATPFSGLVLTLKPEIPRPGETVTISALSVDRDLNALEFIWKVDGKEVADDIGVTSIQVTTPVIGSSSIISVSVIGGGKVYAEEQVELRPAALYLESDAKSSVPPFYIGKRLPGPQSTVVFSAVPDFVRSDGTRLTPSDLFYEWRVNGALKIKPTLGKSSAEFDAPFFNKPFTVSVSAYSKGGALRAEDAAFIVPTDSDLVIYETSPLGGVLDQHAVRDTYTLTAEEVTLTAFPLFVKNPSDIKFSWLLNKSPVDLPPGDTHTVTFRKTAEGSGSYNVSASFSNPVRFLERGVRSFLLQF